MKPDSKSPLLIGRLAKLADVKTDTVRFYERCGLLPKPKRMTSGYRVYDEVALKRLLFIKQAQSLGFSLDEVRKILSLRGRGKETCRCVLGIAEATLLETEQKLQELQSFRDGLHKTLARWRNPSNAGGTQMAAEFCALIESSAPQKASQIKVDRERP